VFELEEEPSDGAALPLIPAPVNAIYAALRETVNRVIELLKRR
jgi:hypothetical protein